MKRLALILSLILLLTKCVIIPPDESPKFKPRSCFSYQNQVVLVMYIREGYYIVRNHDYKTMKVPIETDTYLFPMACDF